MAPIFAQERIRHNIGVKQNVILNTKGFISVIVYFYLFNYSKKSFSKDVILVPKFIVNLVINIDHVIHFSAFPSFRALCFDVARKRNIL